MRMRGHAEHDDFSYVPAEQLAAWQAKDPVDTYIARLVADGVVTDAEVADLRAATLATMIAAIDRALDLPWPDASEAFRNVFLS